MTHRDDQDIELLHNHVILLKTFPLINYLKSARQLFILQLLRPASPSLCIPNSYMSSSISLSLGFHFSPLYVFAGRIISNSAEINTRVTDHFSRQFTDPTVDGLDAFTGEPSQLTRPITPEEVTLAIGKLNTGRASGHDDIPAEFLKCSAELLSHTIANIFNDALQHHELLDIGKGVLILVQKPGKPTGRLTSLRPIVLLSVLRKTLSLIVLSRIAPKVDEYLSSSQSGFRRGRSTVDVVFGYRWLCGKAQRQRVTVEFLGIDLSRAFDTIRRDKLLDTLQSFLGESGLRMIRFLLADTSLQPHLSTGDCMAFATTIGTPQGDSLSPVLFTVYLEAALRDLRSRLPTRPPEDAALPLDVEYTDDTDFISRPLLLGHSSTTLSASHHHAWQSGHSPSTVRKRSAQVSADM